MTQLTHAREERQHIESVPGRCGGKPCIVGHRIRVQVVVLWTEQGMSPDTIVTEFPQLTLSNVFAALAYYFDNKAAIDQQIADEEEFVAAMKAKHGSGPLGEVK